MGGQSKKKTFSFSLTEEEAGELLALTKKTKFADRNEFLLALIEAAKFLNLAPFIDEHDMRVLRPRAQETKGPEPHSTKPSEEKSAGAPPIDQKKSIKRLGIVSLAIDLASTGPGMCGSGRG